MEADAQAKIEEEHKRLFLEKLHEMLEKCDILTKERYDQVMYVLDNRDNKEVEKPKDYHNICKYYAIVPIGGVKIIVRNNKDFESLMA